MNFIRSCGDDAKGVLVVQVHSVLSDNKSQELWAMLREARRAEKVTIQDMIRYRREAERHVGADEHLYRIEWVSGSILENIC